MCVTPAAAVVEEGREVAREVVERPAGRHDVHEPEQRRTQLRVLGREVHRLAIERLERPPGERGEGRREIPADLTHRGFQCLSVHAA
jgi:hypothetical protein